MNKLPLLAVLMLIGSLAAANLTVSIGDIDPTPTKLANYSYQTTLKNGTALSTDTVANSIDAKKNLLLDCPGIVCDYKVKVNATMAQEWGEDTLTGAYIGEGVSVQKTFIEETTTKENCTTEKNGTTSCDNTSTTTENTDLTKPFTKGEIRTYVIRFVKDNTINANGNKKYNNQVVDIYHTIYGQARTEGALWNSTGGTITYDGLYTVATFTANGSFNVTGTIPSGATALIVAGGGGGGGSAGGGGGAGGLIYNSSMADLTGNYTVVVGQGGAGSWGLTGNGGNGTNSSFGGMISLTANGGGGGSSNQGVAAVSSGGSGGGAGGWASGTTGSGQATPAGQGFNGGNNSGRTAVPYPSGGGGGAGAIGQSSPSSNASGSGGAGLNYSINGTSICYAGGGGGGIYDNYSTTPNNLAGQGGCPTAGAGHGRPMSGYNATNGFGGGGGGGSSDGSTNASGWGGSGIVIIRYLTYVATQPNITFYIQTSTPQYNGTMVNFTFKGVFWNPTGASQTLNLTVTANGTTAATATNAVLAAGNITELNGNWTGQRATLDADFSIGATATSPNGTLSATNLTMLLPIDPPSAINLMASGGKDRCRTPQQIGYWDARNWTINASWGCNYSNLNLTRNITYADSGTTTFTNSNITSNWFNRLIGNAGTAAIFIFKTSVLRIKGGV